MKVNHNRILFFSPLLEFVDLPAKKNSPAAPGYV
jgi:hypothetical protein